MFIYIPILLILAFIQHVRNFTFKKNEKYWYKGRVKYPSRDYRDVLLDLYYHSPVYKSNHHHLYVCKVPFDQKPNGMNHNSDHSGLRNGVYLSIMKKIGIVNDDMIRSQNSHYDACKDEFHRGYYVHEDGSLEHHSYNPVSGDVAVGHCFAYIHQRDHMELDMASIAYHCIKNQGFLTAGKISTVANFIPGIQGKPSETPVVVGAQNITYLAVVRSGMDAVKRLDPAMRKFRGLPSYGYFAWHYYKRLFIYGAFISVMFPTVGVWWRRSYNNDAICMMAAFILYKLSSNRLEKLIYGISGFYIWSLSWPWLNGFFSGLLREMLKKFPSEKYMSRCLLWAIDLAEVKYGSVGPKEKSSEWPIDPKRLEFDEFAPERSHEDQYSDPSKIQYVYRDNVGQLAALVWSKT